MSENPYTAPKTSLDAPSFTAGIPNRRLARVDAIAAILFLLGTFWMHRSARIAAEEAVRLYGRNVDSGAYFDIMATFYFAPATILFSVASVALFRGWRFCRVIHWLACIWWLTPVVFSLVSFVRQVVVAAAA